jgi:hypothetical protein
MRGTIALAEGRLEEARAALDSVITHSKSAQVAQGALLIRAELNLNEGKMAAAEADAQRAVTIAQTAQGDVPYSDRTGLGWLILGRVLAKQGAAARAHAAFQAAVENLSNTVDADHPMLVRARELARN